MLTWEDDVEVHALHKRGWSISAIARHTGRDRKTVRAYLNGTRTPGVRTRSVIDGETVCGATVWGQARSSAWSRCGCSVAVWWLRESCGRVAVVKRASRAAAMVSGASTLTMCRAPGTVKVLGPHRGCNVPSADLPGAYVGDERGVGEPGPGPDVGDVDDPQLIRLCCNEITFHQIPRLGEIGIGSGSEHLPPAYNAADPGQPHQPPRLLPPDRIPVSPQRGVHLLHPVHAEVAFMDRGHDCGHLTISDRTWRWHKRFRQPVPSGRQEHHARCAQHTADELDPELIAMNIDERDHLVVVWSSSDAKSALAALRSSLVRRKSETSFFSRRISACSSVVVPGR